MAPRPLLDLSGLPHLTAINLSSDNALTEAPPALGKLSGLAFSTSPTTAPSSPACPLTWLALPALRWVDLRGVHAEPEGARFWAPAKCETMQHAGGLARAVRRRRGQVLLDSS